MDEPFSALDPLIRRDMQELLVRLQTELRKTIVFITHDLNEAMRLGDRILLLKDGRLVQLGTGPEILAAPADDYVADFVRDVPKAHVLTLRWIMRDPRPGEATDGPQLDVRTVVKDALPVVAATDGVVRAVDGDRVVGVVDRVGVLQAMTGGRGDDGGGR
jgi:glycine betaine/proline transport system ATP-binding protein